MQTKNQSLLTSENPLQFPVANRSNDLNDDNYNDITEQEVRSSISLKANILLQENEEDHEQRLSRMSKSSAYNTLVPVNSKYMTTFMLLNYMIGSGILNQPYVVMKSGIIGAICGFMLASYMTWRCCVYLTEAGLYTEIYDYSAIAMYAFGKHGERVIDVSIVLGQLGGVSGYILVIGSILSSLLLEWGCSSNICSAENIVSIVVICIIAPLCLFRHFGHLSYLAIFSVGAIWTVIFLVLIGGPFYQVPTDNHITLFNPSGALVSLGSMIFALSLCTGNFPAFVSTEKSAQNAHDWNRISGAAVAMGCVMCLGLGIAGYLFFRQDTEGVIVDNFTAPGFEFFKVMIVMHLIFYLPAGFVIMRYSAVKLMFNKISTELPPLIHTVISLALVGFLLLLVIFLLSTGLSSGAAFSLVLNLTGGIAGSLTSFILPTAIYIKISTSLENKLKISTFKYYESRIIFGLGIIIMFVVVIMTILSVSN